MAHKFKIEVTDKGVELVQDGTFADMLTSITVGLARIVYHMQKHGLGDVFETEMREMVTEGTFLYDKVFGPGNIFMGMDDKEPDGAEVELEGGTRSVGNGPGQ